VHVKRFGASHRASSVFRFDSQPPFLSSFIDWLSASAGRVSSIGSPGSRWRVVKASAIMTLHPERQTADHPSGSLLRLGRLSFLYATPWRTMTATRAAVFRVVLHIYYHEPARKSMGLGRTRVSETGADPHRRPV
jgi:hypothetical protein